MFKRVLSIALFISLSLNAQGYLKTEGRDIVNDSGKVLLRGIGLGGWLVPEGYMLKSQAKANSPTEIKNEIIDLIGETETEDFFKRYRANFVTERDIDSIASWGFNSVRLPMHYELLTPRNSPGTYSESGFAIIDSLLDWCGKNRLYLILDLHAAPGGQSDEPISDYDANFPSLWESEANKQRTVDLWGEIAKRYYDEKWIGGYDLLNEPKWELGPVNAALRDLYIRITDTIRTADTNHILFIEGNWFATSFDGLTPPWDENMVYSFHKYWNKNETGVISYLLSIRTQYNVPLWLGESGENSNSWFTDAITLMENNNIGWSWWTIKKLGGINSLFNVPIPAQYQQVIDYWNGKKNKPSQLFAVASFIFMTDALKTENSKVNIDVLDAMMRQPYDDSPKIYKNNSAPGFIYATDFDMGRRGVAYQDKDYENIGGGTWNNGWLYRNDGIDIELCEDGVSNGFNVGWIEDGEWMKYTFSAQETGEYSIIVRFASQSGGGKLLVWIDGVQIGQLADLYSTGGWQSWEDYKFPDNLTLSKGEHQLMIQAVLGGFNLNYYSFDLITSNEDEESVPAKFKLEQNYPNPFGGAAHSDNPETRIKYSLVSSGEENKNKRRLVNLSVYDALGRKVANLVNKAQTSGSYEVSFEGSGLASGVYFYRLRIGGKLIIKKMILIE